MTITDGQTTINTGEFDKQYEAIISRKLFNWKLNDCEESSFIITKEILQQFIEWVDKEVIGEDEVSEDLKYEELTRWNDRRIVTRNTLRASQRKKLQQLKEEV